MKIRVRLFALYRERAGCGSLTLELPAGARVRDLTDIILRRFPNLAPEGASLVTAVNAEYAAADTRLEEGDEVALIPPVSGGGEMVELTSGPLVPEEIASRVASDTCGAVVTFLGTARLYSQGKRVLYLEYEAYPEMALKMLEQVRQEVKERWGVEEVAISHRTGRVEIGQVSLVVAVAAPHREEAFQACQHAVDRIKEVVPIWKREVFEDGHVWVGRESEGHRRVSERNDGG